MNMLSHSVLGVNIMNKKSLLYAAIISVIVLSWFFRYDIVTSDKAAAYRLDRWTGNVEFIVGARMERAERVKK